MSIGARRFWRISSVVGAAALITTTSLGVRPALAAEIAPAAASSVLLAGWGGGSWGGGSWGGWSDQPDPATTNTPDSSTAGTSTVDSDPATDAEQTGVVLIDTELAYQGAAGAGTGIVLTANGEILTNYHVVEGATAVHVTVASTGETYAATVLGHSETADIALLQLKGASGLTPATIDDDTVSTGDPVTAVGNAGGTGSLTAADGTVTNLRSSVTTASEGSIGSETLTGLIQTDADVIAGDSGGPLLDAEGEVVGIDTAASTGDEIDGYAVPIATAESVVKQIRSGAETRTVQIGASAFLGVEVVDAGFSDQPGAYFGNNGWDTSSDAAGATISGVLDDSAAAAAGLGVGDTLTKVGNTKIGTAAELTTVMAGHDPGDRVTIGWTDAAGDSHTATVTLGASPEA